MVVLNYYREKFLASTQISKCLFIVHQNFTEQNPHWETDWMAEREKAYEKCSEQRRRQRDEEILVRV